MSDYSKYVVVCKDTAERALAIKFFQLMLGSKDVDEAIVGERRPECLFVGKGRNFRVSAVEKCGSLFHGCFQVPFKTIAPFLKAVELLTGELSDLLEHQENVEKRKMRMRVKENIRPGAVFYYDDQARSDNAVIITGSVIEGRWRLTGCGGDPCLWYTPDKEYNEVDLIAYLEGDKGHFYAGQLCLPVLPNPPISVL